MKKTMIVCALPFLVVSLAGCSAVEDVIVKNEEVQSVEKKAEVPKDPEGVEKVESSEEKKETVPTTQRLRLGDTVNFKGVEITLNSARTDVGESFFTAENDKFVIVDVSVKNNKDEEVTVSSLVNFKLKDADGYQYNPAIFAETKANIDGDVSPGGTIRGEIAFDVPNSAKYELVFENLWEDGQAIWHFTAK